MTLAIMQPYFFPYVGYFQLIHAADKFVFYDDVAFRKKGWIQRNKILVNGGEHIFTVPIKNASSFVAINHTGINRQLYDRWKTDFLKTLAMSYGKAPHYKAVYELVEAVLNEPHDTIATLGTASVVACCNYIGLKKELVLTADRYHNNELRSQERVLDICRQEGATTYVNAIGGKELYAVDDFAARGIELKFIKTRLVPYEQHGGEFVPWLSIIDIMMFNEPEQIRAMFGAYDFC